MYLFSLQRWIQTKRRQLVPKSRFERPEKSTRPQELVQSRLRLEIRSFPSGKSARFIRTKLILICNLPPFNTKTPPPHRKTNQKAFINKNEETAGRQLKWVIELKSILYLINHTALAVDFYSIKNYISKVHQKTKSGPNIVFWGNWHHSTSRNVHLIIKSFFVS